jgi:hypothetical protein
MRTSRLGWFLGAGASASGGIPTAWEMIWEFKQQLFVSQRKISLNEVKDLTHHSVRRQIQDYISASPNMPVVDAPDEYARLFEAAYPSPIDRRDYIDKKIKQGKPSTGHIVLALLLRDGFTKAVWTTNFDAIIEDAFAKTCGTTANLTVAGLDNVNVAEQVMAGERWPLYTKIHGDFRSEQLKNSSSELETQDNTLRRLLKEFCCRQGLIVAGYSGRDDSVMEVFEDALTHEKPFPNGLFWMQRGGDEPLPRVSRLIDAARQLQVEAGIVPIENFNEAMYDLANLVPNFDKEPLDTFAQDRSRWSAPPIISSNHSYPIIRFNAILVEEIPTECTLVECDIGGHREIAAAIDDAEVNVLAARNRAGVLAFGEDADLMSAFSQYNVRSLAAYEIEKRRLRYDSQERGLLRSAIGRAISSAASMELYSLRQCDRLKPKNLADPQWAKLAAITKKPLSGGVAGAIGLKWFEGVEVQLDWADENLWLLIEPKIIFEGLSQENKAQASSHARELMFNRYNQTANQLIDFWTSIFVGSSGVAKALDVRNGRDAVFRFNRKSGHSWRATA